MVDIRRGGSGDAARERLPWLEPVEDEDDYYASENGGYGGLILAAILVLVAIALLTAGILWYRGQRGMAGSGQIIKAETGPYKVRPPNPGGMQADTSGEVTADTGAGGDVNSPIDLSALPEEPMVGPARTHPVAPPQPTVPGQPQQAVPAATPRPVPVAALPATPPVAIVPPPTAKAAPVPKPPVAAAPAAPDTAPAGGGTGVIQLGAFSSEAKAKAAWKTLSARFAGLRDLGLAISPVESGDKTLYRLRASGAANAARLCAQLRVAGESCSVVN